MAAVEHGPFHTVAEIEAASLKSGDRFFTEKDRRVWKTRVHWGVWGGRYFVVSDKGVDGTGRLYQVKRATDKGVIMSVPGFSMFRTAARARGAAVKIAELGEEAARVFYTKKERESNENRRVLQKGSGE